MMRFYFRFFMIFLLWVTLISIGVNYAYARVSGDSWAYLLQNIDIQQIAQNSTFDLIVMDYSSDGGASGEWLYSEIETIRNSGKKAIAYISIGEAEDYRFYWDPIWLTNPPAWLGPENPDWPGNYKVRFWHTDWQDIVFQYLDRIIAQGFDGIYMDIIDAYYYWSEEVSEQSDADALMVTFVQNIRNYITTMYSKPEMIIIPQNGEYIIVEDDVTPALQTIYFNSIDAIGIEDIFFPGDLDEDNPYAPDTGRITVLQDYQAQGICVFSVEYLTLPAKVNQYILAASNEGYVPYVAYRELHILNDGIPASFLPTEVPTGSGGTESFTIEKASGNIRFMWQNVCGCNFYNLYRGTLSSLTSGVYDHVCEETSIYVPFLDKMQTSGSWYYIVSAENNAGEGPLGFDHTLQVRPNTAPCNP